MVIFLINLPPFYPSEQFRFPTTFPLKNFPYALPNPQNVLVSITWTYKRETDGQFVLSFKTRNI
jgi:hypothetical protein